MTIVTIKINRVYCDAPDCEAAGNGAWEERDIATDKAVAEGWFAKGGRHWCPDHSRAVIRLVREAEEATHG